MGVERGTAVDAAAGTLQGRQGCSHFAPHFLWTRIQQWRKNEGAGGAEAVCALKDITDIIHYAALRAEV